MGEITHYFSKINVCVLKINRGYIQVGDKIHIKGHTSDFIQGVQSMQIESVDVRIARKGRLIGIKVRQQTRAGDKVYKVLS